MAFRDTVRRVGQIIGIFEEEPAGYYEQDGYYDETQDDGYMPYENTRSGYGAQPRAQQTAGYRQQNTQQDYYEDESYAQPQRGQQAQPVQLFNNNQRSKRPPDNVVNFNRAADEMGRRHSEIILCVRRLEDCQEIINAVLEGKSLFLNMEEIDDVQVQRVIDMLGGAAFALRGTIAKISHRTYLIAPNSVDVVNNQGFAARGDHSSAFRR